MRWHPGIQALMIGLVAACAAVGVTACGSSTGSGSAPSGPVDPSPEVIKALDDLYQKARASGQDEVTVYAAASLDDRLVIQKFEQRYPGIKVNAATVYGADFVTKLQTEHNSGRGAADVVLQGASSVVNQAKGGYFASYTPAGSDNVADIAHDTALGTNCIAPYGDAAVIVYNTQAVNAAEAPKSWADLVDPKWKGKIALPQVTTPGTTSRTFGVLENAGVIDDTWLQKLASQNVVGLAQASQTSSALTSGQAAIGLGRESYLVPDIEKGAPLRVVYPIDGGSTLSAYFGCVLANAPHPDAARLFDSWLFSDEGQTALAANGYYPFDKGQQPIGGFPPIEKITNLVNPSAEQEPTLITSMTAKMAKTFH